MSDLAMKNHVDKPLPTIPKQQDNSFRLTATLSIEARSHARALILHVLEEERCALAKADWDTEKESWASGLVDSLDSLSETIAAGGWLAGIRRSRMAHMLRDKANSSVCKGNSHGEDSLKDSDVYVDKRAQTSSSPSQALQQLHELLSKAVVPTPKPTAKHMLLTTDTFEDGNVIPNSDLGFDIIPSSVGCVFSPNFFLLPLSEAARSNQDVIQGIVLYGLDEWDVDTTDFEHNSTQIVGGNFSFKGVTSALQHASLCKILRLSIYVYLSLILEQHFLSDSHVKLNLPKQRPSRAPLPPTVVLNDRRRTSSDSGRKHRESLPSGVWSFLSRKTEHLLHRAAGLRSGVVRHGSLDLTQEQVEGIHSQQEHSHQRTRTFSFLPDTITWSNKPKKEEVDPFASGPPFRATIDRIERSRHLLSTTAGLIFPLPSLLLSLTEKEGKDTSRRLTAAERLGLNTVLGWEGRDARGRSMVGILGFVKQQCICVLHSEHIVSRAARPDSVANTSDSASTSSTISSTTITSVSRGSALTRCGRRARWKCFRYYPGREGADRSLGETIVHMCSVAEDLCGSPGCPYKRGDHESRFIHGGVRIVVGIDSLETKEVSDYVEMWESCHKCGEETTKSRMSDGTFLLSFGKYIELLLYSHNLHSHYPTLCEHTSISMQKDQCWLDISRHFSYQTHRVTFSFSVIDVFDVHVPRLQVCKSGNDKQTDMATASLLPAVDKPISDIGDPKRVLRKEIIDWWQDVSGHMDRLEEVFIRHDNLKALLKSLPRLPSSDDAFEDYDDFDVESTPRAAISGLPYVDPPQQTSSLESAPVHDSPALSPSLQSEPLPSAIKTDNNTRTPLSKNYLPPTPQNIDKLQLLSRLRHDFQREEQKLYAQLSKTSATSLNDARRAFVTSSKGALKRLSAWEAKHVPKNASLATSLSAREPAWWADNCHAVTGGNVIVREGDWGSIIAFTLSSEAYLNELTAMSFGKGNFQVAPLSPTTNETSRPSIFARPSYRLFQSFQPAPDPDDNRVIWQEQEVCSTVISRKEHPRDPSSLLSLRDVLRKPSADSANVPSSSRFTSVGTPPSAWAKPAVDISVQSVGGQLEVLEMEGAAGRLLKDMDAVSDNISSRDATSSPIAPTASSSTSPPETHIRRGRASSVLPYSEQADTTVKATENRALLESEHTPTPDDMSETSASESRASTDAPSHSLMPSSLTGGISQVMRYILNTGETRPTSPGIKGYHGLLSLESSAIDERPHIKYDWTIGKRLKFSCTVYYAKQFDALRRRCNIDDVFLKSIERSDNWMAEGGKSKSNFWKTSDERFIIKTLVNAWNVADLQVLIELGPSYFRYMDSTANKPTILAKLLGFYTVEIRNLESGTTQAKADLLVMENLFYDKKIVKTFDLKGIQGRKVKPNANPSGPKTLFDGEWIEGQQRASTLLHPHSKIVLQEAVKSDSEYLSKSNIMDYSLLLGIDIEHKQIACGLVDTIGSYTFAKTLEYKAKQNLKSGKEVTVIPPHEYQERFVNAIDGYFLACPDKWSKPPDDTTVISDPNLLPSVL